MNTKIIIACFDVYYYENYAKAYCVVFNQDDEKIISEYSVIISNIKVYVPGQFYKRELPCILSVFKKVKESIDIIIIDGFIWVNGKENGLGAYLHKSIKENIPVIGVAKSYLRSSTDYLEIYRGKSIKPLYVSAIGINLEYSARLIKNLKGKYRIPDILKKVDKASRE